MDSKINIRDLNDTQCQIVIDFINEMLVTPEDQMDDLMARWTKIIEEEKKTW